MPAYSVTGRGMGSVTNKSQFLPVVCAGVLDISPDNVVSSPPGNGGQVTFPQPLTEGPGNYVVMLTGVGVGDVVIAQQFQDDDGRFTGFSVISDNEGQVMYLIVKCGFRSDA